MKKYFIASLGFLIAALAPHAALAHAFGMKYTLPLPAWMYIYGGGAVVIVSFILIGYFTDGGKNAPTPEGSFVVKVTHLSISNKVKRLFQTLAILLLFLTICAGVFGSQNPGINFAPNFFWIIFLLGCTYAIALLGNFWNALNPWRTLAAIIIDYNPPLKYPPLIGYFPALFVYIVLIWLELLSNGLAVRPRMLAILLLAYTVLTLIGASVFGVAAWFRYGDFFSVFFNLISTVSPIIYQNGRVVFRFPFTGLLSTYADKLSLMLFIVFMLSSTAFDGFRETIKAGWVVSKLSFLPTFQAKQTLLLFVSFILFVVVYALAVWLMRTLVRTEKSVHELLLLFAYSLIPIALAYNLAHYYTLLLVQGQEIIALVSDPFNLGWNLFNTAGFTPNIGIIGAKTVWQSQVLFILIGHIAAVYVAHVIALRIYKDRSKAIMSQLPMLIVMVIYTMAGLWILSQPLQ